MLSVASRSDLDNVLLLYKSLLNTKYCVWDEYYPSMDNIIEDYNNNSLYVIKDNNKIIAAISIVPVNELDDYFNNKNACEIARVGVLADYQNKGYGRLLVSNIIEIVKNRYDAIHLAVEVNNCYAIRLYEHFGFKRVCEAKMYDNTYFLYEKVL